MTTIKRSNPAGLPPYTASQHVNEDPSTGLIFLAGQVGIDESGATVSPSLGPQLEQILRHFDTILASLSLDRSSFLRVQMLTTSRDEFFDEGLQLYKDYFGDEKPAGTLVVVAGLSWSDYKIELEAVLSRGRST